MPACSLCSRRLWRRISLLPATSRNLKKPWKFFGQLPNTGGPKGGHSGFSWASRGFAGKVGETDITHLAPFNSHLRSSM
jgi:hypothetical protein